jgi:uncharacterized protein YcaQ
MRRVTADQARRIALAAQGFTDPEPTGAVDRRHFRRVFRRIGLLQLDSVNVLARSHYLPVLARLGPYHRARLDDYTARSGEVFEYWSHVASLLPVEDYPLYRHRMDAEPIWESIAVMGREHPEYVRSVYDEIAERGPLTVSDLSDPGARTGPWWGYGNGKYALEWLFMKGRITSRRTNGFTRLYDLTERVIPQHLLDAEPVPENEAHRVLLLKAARHHGIGTARDLADYHRIKVPAARPILAGLVAAGELEQVEVPGWRNPVYLHPEADRPRRAHGTALLSPFDSLIWERDRTERIFNFFYREQVVDFLRKRVRDDVEVLGLPPEEQIAHASAHDECGKAGAFQPVQYFQRITGDVRPAESVLGARNNFRPEPRLGVGGVQTASVMLTGFKTWL